MTKLWQYLGRPAHFQFRLALALSAVSGASAVVLLGLSGWFLTASALAGLAGTGLIFNHLFPSAGVRAAAFTRVLSRYGEQLIGHDATLRLSASLRPQLFSQGARATRGLSPMASADLSLLLDDVEAAEGGFLRVIAPAASIISGAVAATALALATDLLLAVLVVLAFVLAAWWLPRCAAKKSRIAAAKHASQIDDARERVARLVENAVELDVIGAMPDTCERARKSLETQQVELDEMERPFRGLGAFNTALGTALALAFLARATTGAVDLALAAGTGLAVIAAFEACAAMVKAVDAAPRSEESASRLLRRLEAPGAIGEPKQNASVQLGTVFPLKFDDLIVTAAERAPRIGPVSGQIVSRSLTELVGPSGSGKTTLAEALMRLQPIQSGALTIAGTPIDRLRVATVLEKMAIAPQFPSFLPGSLYDQFYLADPAVSETQIWEALEIANATDFVTESAKGLKTLFDDGDGRFSGGELRRIGLARALLAGPQILVLDEPFAGLQPTLAEEIARRLTRWATDGDRAIILLQHAPTRFEWTGLRRNLISLAPSLP